MAITALTITNPGAESGSMTGWTVDYTGSVTSVTATGGVSPNSGTRMFMSQQWQSEQKYHQDIAVPGGITAAVDAGDIAVKLAHYYRTTNSDPADSDKTRSWIALLDGSGNILIEAYNPWRKSPGVWLQDILYLGLTPGTRTIRIGFEGDYDGATPFSAGPIYRDDFTLDYSDAPTSDWPATEYAHQLGVYAIGAVPAESAYGLQLGTLAVANAETSTGFHDIKSYQLGAYALVRPHADRQDLTAWTFKQDDHEFYVLQLQGEDTLVYDKLTNRWSDFVSPNYDHWRGADGCNWEGIAVACDTKSGILWQIDPEGRLDYETTPITSVIVGGFTERFRSFKPVYLAELAVSEGQPPDVDVSTIGITLRTGDGKGNWTDHGQVLGEDVAEDITVRWYGLGLAGPPGMVFEITDTGYARRIDGLDVEIGE
jgi:hypothetical protein